MKIQPWIWWKSDTYWQMSGVGADKGGDSLGMVSCSPTTGVEDTIGNVGGGNAANIRLYQYLSCIGEYVGSIPTNDGDTDMVGAVG